MTLTLKINGEQREVTSDPETPLVYVLRDELKLKGTRLGCGLEQCGTCAVLVDGEPTLSCVSPVASFEGKEITTIEGLAATEVGARVQAAFVEATAAQCGYCTSGLVVAVTGLLARNPDPDRETAKRELTPHLCRCGSHPRVLRAVEIASRRA
ncbi:MAG: (2Fe-2S)-binding protein [Silicimonas sp.]|nr:(2Fe-2S)-binding protein [Silicimonas sp.]